MPTTIKATYVLFRLGATHTRASQVVAHRCGSDGPDLCRGGSGQDEAPDHSFIDGTELDCSSIQSMIATIENEHGQVKSIALDGVSLLEKKTAEVAADATIRTFSTTRELVSDVKSAYVSALINRDTSPLPAGRDKRA